MASASAYRSVASQRRPPPVLLKPCVPAITELPPVTPLRLKIEINTREHFQVFDVERRGLRKFNQKHAVGARGIHTSMVG